METGTEWSGCGDVATRQQVTTLQHGEWIDALSFSPDGTLLATVGGTEQDGNNTVLWDVASRKQVATFPADGWVLSFSPDGTLLATRGDPVTLWDVANRQEVAIFQVGAGYWHSSHSLSFSPDGTLLAIGGTKGSDGNWSDENWDGVVWLWDVSKWKAPHPAKLVKISGDNQQSTPGTALDHPLVIEVRDQHGKSLPNANVTFSVTAGGGTLASTTATTDANGHARSTLTLGSDLGTNTVTATVAGLDSITFTATTVEQVPHSLTKVSGDGQQGQAGEQLAKPFVVLVLDEDGAAMARVSVTFTVTAGGRNHVFYHGDDQHLWPSRQNADAGRRAGHQHRGRPPSRG